MKIETADPIAVITGAGTGIGRCVAERLAADHHIIAIGRRTEPLQALADALPGRITPLALDVADHAAVDDALADLPSVRVLVINHGVCQTVPHDAAEAVHVFHRTLAINLSGAMHVLHALSPRIVDGGRVITVASGLGKLGRGGKSAYAASKHGLLGLTRCVADELAPRRITVNGVCPGWVDTDMARADVVREAGGGDPAAVRREAESHIPLGRFVKPDEVAALITWLCSPEANMITGQAYNISGGEFGA